MHYKNGFELLIAVIFNMIPKIGGVGTKAQDIVVPFFLGEVLSLPDSHVIAFSIKSELILLGDKTSHINNLTGK